MTSSSQDEAARIELCGFALVLKGSMKLKEICVARSTRGPEDGIRKDFDCFPSPELPELNDFGPNLVEWP